MRWLSIKKLKITLANASTYSEWKEIAQELDVLEGKEEWRKEEASPNYQYQFMKEQIIEIRKLRQSFSQL